MVCQSLVNPISENPQDLKFKLQTWAPTIEAQVFWTQQINKQQAQSFSKEPAW